MTKSADVQATEAGAGDSGAAAARQLLDNRTTPCAVGLIKAARTMAQMAPGSELEIWSRDHFAPVEIPLFAERDGYGVQQLPNRGRWPTKYFVFVVSKPTGG